MANNYVLVHGAWHGGWAWTPVAKHLAAQGHKVYTPTLAGHGPDAQKAGIRHQDCVDSLVNYVKERDLRDIIMVGHSWGGNMLCGAAPLLQDRVQRLIFWNAFVLNDGESLLDVMPENFRQLFAHLAAASPERTITVPWEVWRGGLMQEGDEEAARLAYNLMTPEPMGVFEDKLDQKAFYALDIPKSYINCRQDIGLPPGEYGWYPRFGERLGQHKLVEIDGCHESCFTRPVELAEAIIAASSD
jgi:pimeloyl-ACP methyl ester carboxylesterase